MDIEQVVDERVLKLAAMDHGLSKNFLISFSIYIEDEVAKRVNEQLSSKTNTM